MDYWQRVIFEVQHRYDASVPKYFVHFPEMNDPTEKKNVVKKVVRTQYFLEGDLSHLYLTEREYQCALGIVQGLTYVALSKRMGLSDRTVESYVMKLKNKLGCKSKMQLALVLSSHGV